MNKYFTIGLVVVLLVAIGAYFYPEASIVQSLGTSIQGSTFTTAKIASIAINLANPGANATSSSILNTDSNDRFIVSEEVGCEGVGTSKTAYTGAGLASLTLIMATSSTAAPTANGNTNALPTVTIGTSTPNFVIASSTAGTPGTNLVSNIWAAGSYLTITANATNTAVCSAGIRYLGS